MASKLASLVVALGLDSTEYDRELNRAAGKLRKLGDDLSTIGQTLTLGITAPIVAMGGAALKAAGSMEQAQVAFTTMFKSGQKAQEFLKELQQFALRTPFEFQDLTDAAKRMMALGFAARDVIPTMTTVGNAVSALGGGKDLIDRVILALGQMKAKGTVQAEEMRQLAEAGIPAWDALAKKLNTDVAGAMKAVEKRTVDSATAINAAMEAMNQRFAGGMDAQSKTLLGQWSNVKDRIFTTLNEIGQAMLPAAKSIIDGYVNPLLAKVSELAKGFSQLSPEVQKASIALMGLLAVIPPLVWGIGAFIEKWGVLAPVLVRVGGAITGIVTSLSGVGAIAIGVGSAVAWLGSKMLDHSHVVNSTDQAIKQLNERYYGHRAEVQKTNTAYDSMLDYVRQIPPTQERAKKSTAELGEKFHDLGTAMQGPITAADQMREALSSVAGDAMRGSIQRGIDAWTEATMRAAGYGKAIETVTAKMKDYQIVTDTFQVFDFSKGFPTTADPNQGFDGGYARPVLTEGSSSAASDAKAARRELQEVSTVLDDLHKGLVGLMFDGGKFKDVMVGAATNIGKAFARMVVTDLMKPFDDFMKAAAKWVADLASSIIKNLVKGAFGQLSSAIGGALAQLGGLGKSISGMFGGGASAASSAAGSMGGAGGAAGGIGSAAAGGITGIVGAVGSVVSAISGVVGNFQMAGMNKSLDLIVKHTLQTANQLIYGLQPQVNTYLPALSGIHDRLMEFRVGGIGVYPQPGYDWGGMGAGGGVGSVTLEVNGGYFMSQRAMEDFFQMFMDFLRARGVKIG